MLVITGIFENERFIPDKPVFIPQKKKVVVTIEEHTTEASNAGKLVKTNIPLLTMIQIEEWAKTPEIQSLVGVLEGANLPIDYKLSDVRNERLEVKYKI